MDTKNEAPQNGAVEGAPVDRISNLFPIAGEPLASWIVRIITAPLRWRRKPRSRVGWIVALACGLALATPARAETPDLVAALVGGGLGMTAWHNYCVADAEAYERAQIEAGLIPMVKTNGGVFLGNWKGYFISAIVAGGASYIVARWARAEEDRAEPPVIIYPPETVKPEQPEESGETNEPAGIE